MVRVGDLAIEAACQPTVDGDVLWIGCAAHLTNAADHTVVVAAVEAETEGATVHAWTLDPGGSIDLPAPSGAAWAVVAEPESSVARDNVYRIMGNLLLWGLAGWGAGSIVASIVLAFRRRR